MRIANVNNERTPPSPGATGTCPACDSPVIAKCGVERIHHWAHRGKRLCDQWWEARTQWHYDWQDKFPLRMQERIFFADCGERHVADVHTDHGVTIEFQHSHLRREERIAREKFYRNLLWVVDGTRLKRDAPRFLEGLSRHTRRLKPGVRLTLLPERVLPKNWLGCAVPVFFDFANAKGLPQEALSVAQKLWCLLPSRVRDRAVILQVSRETFVRLAHERSQIFLTKEILREVEEMLVAEERAKQERLARQSAADFVCRHQRRRRPSHVRRAYPRF